MNRIREMRMQRGLSVASLAEMIGVPRQTLWRWETGQQEPNGRHLLALARLLGIPPQDIFPPEDVATERRTAPRPLCGSEIA